MDRPELESLLSLQSAPCLADWNQPGICTVLRSSPRPLPGLLSHLLLLLPHSFHSSSVSFSLLLEQTNFFLPQGLCLGCSICLELLQAPPPPGCRSNITASERPSLTTLEAPCPTPVPAVCSKPHMHAHSDAHTTLVGTWVHMQAHTCMHTEMHTCMHAHMSTHMGTHVHRCKHTETHAYLHAHTGTHVHT